MSFAYHPPSDSTFLVTQMWDKHMSPKWRENQVNPRPQPNSGFGKKISEEVRRFKEGSISMPSERLVDSDVADHMIIERMVSAQRGKWKRFPPEVVNRHKNQNGEWEETESLPSSS